MASLLSSMPPSTDCSAVRSCGGWRSNPPAGLRVLVGRTDRARPRRPIVRQSHVRLGHTQRHPRPQCIEHVFDPPGDFARPPGERQPPFECRPLPRAGTLGGGGPEVEPPCAHTWGRTGDRSGPGQEQRRERSVDGLGTARSDFGVSLLSDVGPGCGQLSGDDTRGPFSACRAASAGRTRGVTRRCDRNLSGPVDRRSAPVRAARRRRLVNRRLSSTCFGCDDAA